MSASFSRRLRRRFSRESKQSGEHRIPFPFSLKSKPSIANTDNDLAVFQDMGSSLMNPRGYDSDAQCVGSPQHVESVNGSPSPGSRRMEQNKMAQGSREFDNIPSLKNGNGQNYPGSPSGSFGVHNSPTPHGSMRGYPGQSSARYPARIAGNHSTTSFSTQRSDEQSNFARPNLHLHPSQDQLTPPTHPDTRRQGAFLTSSGENLQNLVVDWENYMQSSTNGMHNASSESLGRQPPEILMPKRRQFTGTPRTNSEARVPDLSDLDLPHGVKAPALASGPPSGNASIAEMPRANRYGSPMMSLENVQSSMRSGSSTIGGPETPTKSTPHYRDVSSFYSRQSDEALGSGASNGIHSLRAHAANVMEGLPNIQSRLVCENGVTENAPAAADEVTKSKFGVHQEFVTPRSAQIHTAPATNYGMRKVSPGWMTGGRRMGYGYTLVDSAESSPQQALVDGGEQANTAYGRHVSVSATGTADKHGLDESVRQRTNPLSPAQTPTPNGDSRTSSSHHSPSKIPTDLKHESIISPIKWVKAKRYSVRGHGHGQAPLAVDLAGEGMYPGNSRNGGVLPVRPYQHTTPTKVDYVEDDDNFLGRWPRGSVSSKRQSQSHKKDGPSDNRAACTPEPSPTPNRRFSMDQTNRRPSVYFDPANQRSADKLNRQPSRSRSGRWILRFSRMRDSKRRSSKLPKELSPDSSAEYEECASSGLGRADSVRSDIAADLANEYQECIHMPGAFYGSGWASRTSLIVDAE